MTRTRPSPHPQPLVPWVAVFGLALAGCGAGGGGDDDSAAGDDDTSAALEVHDGGSIQDALDQAGPGVVIRVHPGTYPEALQVAYDGAVLEGVVEGGSRPVLDGGGTRDNAVSGTSDGFRISGFRVQDYTQNGVWITNSADVAFADMEAANTGRYGLYASQCTQVVVRDSVIWQSADAGIYIGQGEGALVQGNEVYDSVAGVECENTTDCEVSENHIHGNTSGVLNILLPGLARKDNLRSVVRDNLIEDNNLANFANPADFVSNVPRGGGIILFGGDDAWVAGNTVTGHDSFGIGVYSLWIVFSSEEIAADPSIDPWTDTNVVQDNVVTGSGADPDPLLTDLGVPGADLLWDAQGDGNCWAGNTFDVAWSASGTDLPACP